MGDLHGIEGPCSVAPTPVRNTTSTGASPSRRSVRLPQSHAHWPASPRRHLRRSAAPGSRKPAGSPPSLESIRSQLTLCRRDRERLGFTMIITHCVISLLDIYQEVVYA